jgi:hypothetical protein
MRELSYFEELGLFHRQRVVRTKTVELMLGTVVTGRWEMWKPTIEKMRQDEGCETYYEYFGHLAERLERRRKWLGRRHRACRWLITSDYPRGGRGTPP